MKVKVLKHVYFPKGTIGRYRRKVAGTVIDTNEGLKQYEGWIKDKIKEGIFKEIKERKPRIKKEKNGNILIEDK